MYYYKNTLLIILSFVSILFSESGYNTIYLMEFENQQNEFTNTRLTEALPDLIKENYKFREDIKVDRKSTRLNSSHALISYAVFCLKKKKNKA